MTPLSPRATGLLGALPTQPPEVLVGLALWLAGLLIIAGHIHY